MRRLPLLIAFLTACAGNGAKAPVVIGAAGPFAQTFGASTRRGIEYARDEINAAGGVNGRPLEVVFKDDSGSGALAARIAQQFVDDVRVLGVVGHVTSAPMLAAARVYDGHLAAIATSATNPALSGISPWTFRVISSDSANGVTLAQAAGTMGLKRAAILYENDGYGRGLAAAFRGAFKGTVIAADPIDATLSNAEPYIAFIKREAAELVFVAGNDASGLALLREARRQQLKAQFIGGDGWTPVIVDTAASEGALIGTPFTALDPRPEARKFVDGFRAKYHTEPDDPAALGYDATVALTRAIASGGADRGAVRAWLHAIPAAQALAGATGPIRFRDNGDPIGKSIILARAKQGRLVVEKTK